MIYKVTRSNGLRRETWQFALDAHIVRLELRLTYYIVETRESTRKRSWTPQGRWEIGIADCWNRIKEPPIIPDVEERIVENQLLTYLTSV